MKPAMKPAMKFVNFAENPASGKTATLAFEIGTEEIPAFDLARATKQLPDLAKRLLGEADLAFKAVEVFTTPRRLILVVHELAAWTRALHEEYKGPAVSIAFDDKGEPTKAAEGFARGKGLSVDGLERREVGGVEYLYAMVNTAPRASMEILPGLLLDLINTLSWPKSMRWARHRELFSRPVRWLLALLDDEVIPLEYAGLTAGRFSSGHRFLSPGPHEVSSADGLLDVVRGAFVVPGEDERRRIIEEEVTAIEKSTGLKAVLHPKTLTEVVNLCEYPTVLRGRFDEDFLAVPQEIIVDAMLVHQRYFPLYDGTGRLSNSFIIVSNGDPACKDAIIAGNERVVRPRLSDAKFFYTEDLKVPLDRFVERLDELVFQEALGTMRAKTQRLTRLVEILAEGAAFTEVSKKQALRAAYLAKADLVSNAVIEFTSVQGIMGAYYAQAAGEDGEVVRAIAEHYRPKFSGDELPETEVGRLVACADKIDTVCGLFAVDQAPTGSSDPFALRRAAIGVIALLLEGLAVSLEDALKASLNTYDALPFDRRRTYEALCLFFAGRIKGMMRDKGFAPDAVEAVMAAGLLEPRDVYLRVQALEDARRQNPEVMDDLAVAYARANNLCDESLGYEVVVEGMDDAEKALFSAIEKVEAQVGSALVAKDHPSALHALAALRDPIDTFFVDVLIMSEDEALKNNRLRLLNRFVAVFAKVADFGLLAKR